MASAAEAPRADLSSHRLGGYQELHRLRSEHSDYPSQIRPVLAAKLRECRQARGAPLRILSVGAADGAYDQTVFEAAGAGVCGEYTGVDVDADALAQLGARAAQLAPNVRLKHGAFEPALFDEGERFDAVLFVHSIHLMCLDPAFSLARSLLADGGLLLVAIQGAGGVPALHARATGTAWPHNVAETVEARLVEMGAPHEEHKLSCTVDLGGAHRRQIVEFMLFFSAEPADAALRTLGDTFNEPMSVFSVYGGAWR